MPLTKKETAIKNTAVITIGDTIHDITLFLSIALMFYIVNTCDTTVSRISYICCDILILLYTLVQCLIPYKNPNLSKSKSYKYAVRLSFGCSLVLFLLVLLTGDMGLLSLADKIRG